MGRAGMSYIQKKREELLQSPRIGIENYPPRKAFATHLSDNGFSRKYRFLIPLFKEKNRDKKNKRAAPSTATFTPG